MEAFPSALLEDGSSYKGKRAIKRQIRTSNDLLSVLSSCWYAALCGSSSASGFLLAYLPTVSFYLQVAIFPRVPSFQSKVSEKKTM